MQHISYSDLRLADARSDLERAWQATGAAWRDEARVQFEEEYMQEFLSTSHTTIKAMDKLNNLLKRVMRQCS